MAGVATEDATKAFGPLGQARSLVRSRVPNAEVHVLDAGHLALDTKADEIAALVREFMKTHKTGRGRANGD